MILMLMSLVSATSICRSLCSPSPSFVHMLVVVQI
jgi:hypothetical protein